MLVCLCMHGIASCSSRCRLMLTRQGLLVASGTHLQFLPTMHMEAWQEMVGTSTYCVLRSTYDFIEASTRC